MFLRLFLNLLVGEGKTTHTTLDTEDVVVGGKHVEHIRVGVGLESDLNLGVVDTREVASAGGLVLLGLEGERVGVDTGVGAARVMVVGLHLVEVLAGLSLEAVLTVEDELEGAEGTGGDSGTGGTLLSPRGGATGEDTGIIRADELGSTDGGGGGDHGGDIGSWEGSGVGAQNNRVGSGDLGGKVPHGSVGRRVGERPHELLDGMVVGKTDLLGTAGGGGVSASMLHLLDEVLVTLLGEATALLGVEVDVVAPHLEDGGGEVDAVIGGEIEVDANLVVLEGDEGKVETGVAVEEEDEGEVDGTRSVRVGVGGHLTPVGLLGLIEVELGVQTPPALVVLIDTLTTDGKLNGADRTLGGPAGIGLIGTGRGAKGRLGLKLDVHVADEITVAGDGDGKATGVGNGAVHGLLDVLHRKVGVTLVHRLEERDLRVSRKVDVLSAISYKLH